MDPLAITIGSNYQQILERIERAARRAGRNPADVRLVVVTKTHPVQVIWPAIQAGARCLGENYADEAVPKILAIREIPGGSGASQVQWHMIGHVQGRKAGLVCQNFDYLHSLDSLKLACRLSRFCTDLGRRLPALLEFNVSGEQSKSGLLAWQEESWPGLLPEIEEVASLPGLEIHGLMAMAPFLPNPEDARPYFQRLRRLQGFLSAHLPQVDWGELSMGMSADFEVAIEEGATWVRVGTAILGERLVGTQRDR